MPEETSPASWERLERKWPAIVNGKQVGFAALRRQMEEFVVKHAGDVRGFSHFGIVVENMDVSVASLTQIVGQRPQDTIRDWVGAYQVHVARAELEGIELELIAPGGQSFFSEFLRNRGEGIHHLSFQVSDIDRCLERLRGDEVDLVDSKARSGSHGKVAFLRPRLFAPLYLELCQPMAKATPSFPAR